MRKKGLLLAVSRCVEKENDLVKKCAVLKGRCTFLYPPNCQINRGKKL